MLMVATTTRINPITVRHTPTSAADAAKMWIEMSPSSVFFSLPPCILCPPEMIPVMPLGAEFLPALCLPALQLRDSTREESAEKARKTHAGQLLGDARLHFRGVDVGQHEAAVLVAVAAVHRAARSVGLGASTVCIALQRHSAALAISVDGVHRRLPIGKDAELQSSATIFPSDS